MVLNIVALVLIIGIIFIQSLFGFFSGLINVFCCITALAVALGFADVLNEFIVRQGFLAPSFTFPVCLVTLFVVTHLVLRVAADGAIRGNVRLPMYVDWGGGALCGFLIGMISVGILILGVLALPWGGPDMNGGGRVMMFSRYQQDVRDRDTQQMLYKRSNIWFNPDGFTVGLFNMLSAGSLASKTTFASVYPDFPEWIFWTGNTVQPESITSPYCDNDGDGFGQKGLKLVSWWEQNTPVNANYRVRVPSRRAPIRPMDYKNINYQPEDGKTLLGMRLALAQATADRDEGTKYHRIRSTMIRVVGDLRDEPRHYCAKILGGTEAGSSTFRMGDLDNNFALAAISDETKIDVYFEVDEGFRPRFVEYRRYARAPVVGEPTSPLSDRLVGRESASELQTRTIGITRFIDAIIADGTGDKVELPFPMSASALTTAGAEIVEGKFQTGRISGYRSTFAATGPGSVQEFVVPQQFRLFQLRCHANQARSLAGRVFNYVGQVVNQYSVSSDIGTAYQLAGYFAIVTRDGRQYVEMYLSSGPDDPTFRGMLDFKFIDGRELQHPDAIIGLLFFVGPGEYILRIQNQTGQGIAFADPGYAMGPFD